LPDILEDIIHEIKNAKGVFETRSVHQIEHDEPIGDIITFLTPFGLRQVRR